MAIFNSYVKLPEGIFPSEPGEILCPNSNQVLGWASRCKTRTIGSWKRLEELRVIRVIREKKSHQTNDLTESWKIKWSTRELTWQVCRNVALEIGICRNGEMNIPQKKHQRYQGFDLFSSAHTTEYTHATDWTSTACCSQQKDKVERLVLHPDSSRRGQHTMVRTTLSLSN